MSSDAENAEIQCEEYLKHALQYDNGSPEPTQSLANLRLTQSRAEEATALMKETYDRLCNCGTFSTTPNPTAGNLRHT